MSKYQRLNKRLNKIRPAKKKEPIKYVAVWGHEADDKTTYIASWQDNHN